MSDLQTVLARMLHGKDYSIFVSPASTASAMCDTPEGKALAALVEAAEAWMEEDSYRSPDCECGSLIEGALMDAIDRYREATK